MRAHRPPFLPARAWRVGVAALGLALAGACTAPTQVPDPRPRDAEPATQVTDGGQVTVAVTWRGPTAGATFDVALNTHAVDLDRVDLGRQAVLRTADGDVAPITWEAPPGGHHRSGTLTFPADVVEDGPIELVIRDVAGVPERAYTWEP